MVYDPLHLYLPRQVLHRLADVLRLKVVGVYEVQHALHVNRCLVGRDFHDVRFILKVSVYFRIDERYSTSSILTVLQRLDDGDAAAMAGQAANGKATLVENIVEGLPKQLAVEDDVILYAILVDDSLETGMKLTRPVTRVGVYTADNVEVNLSRAGRPSVVLADACYQPVVAVPQVYLGHAYQVNAVILVRLIAVQGNAVEVYAVADADGALAEYLLSVRKSDDGRHLPRQSVAEQLVNLEVHARLEREGSKLLVVRIGRNLRDSLDTQLFQLSEKADQPRVGVLETACVDKLNAVQLAVVVYGPVVGALPQSGQTPLAEVGQHLIVNEPASMSPLVEIVVTEMHLVTVLTQSFHLVVYLLTDATGFRKAMVNKKKYSHKAVIWGKSIKKFGNKRKTLYFCAQKT